MKITTYSNNHPDIEIIEINGELTGRGAVQLEDYLYSSMDEGRCSQIINLKHIKKVDGLGLDVLEYFINRGMRIMLFNGGMEIRNLLKISGKEDTIKLYNCQAPDEAVLLFEKEMLKEKNTFWNDIRRRCFQRVKTSLQTVFKSYTSHNDEINYKAVVENLSEVGVMISQINAVNNKTKERVNVLEMVGLKLCNIKFCLNDGTRLIETDGECVWESGVKEELYAGVCFENMKQNQNEMIRDYVKKQKE
ncbi:MAG: PilZ domain-containing protein [Candidatus Scalindua sp.]|nr:PilZ domain-containing protein [Candidatus Scalindua sp.]